MPIVFMSVHMQPTNLVSALEQVATQLARAHEGKLQMQLINGTHECQIGSAGCAGR